ncbi:hypothetical protein BIU88_10395 [Chlorobaculum limnaeum]|uniref:Uncharacterized protein n=1 Tax=Chlorobaculum limnaeum TaxID=274537 RepID=A0A1D8CZY3_CHLLM|nr:hypothetical protein [Chlorobaculum limnaeum]AOS84506.1 hypothetical protein BIU88_10395 [Chlorobaculum limnaeum]
MNYKEKFQDNEWLAVVSIPLWILINIKDNTSKTDVILKKFTELMFNPSEFESPFTKLVFGDLAEKHESIDKYVRTKGYSNGVQEASRLINRKLPDPVRDEFLQDMTELAVILARETNSTESEVRKMMEHVVYTIATLSSEN